MLVTLLFLEYYHSSTYTCWLLPVDFTHLLPTSKTPTSWLNICKLRFFPVHSITQSSHVGGLHPPHQSTPKSSGKIIISTSSDSSQECWSWPDWRRDCLTMLHIKGASAFIWTVERVIYAKCFPNLVLFIPDTLYLVLFIPQQKHLRSIIKIQISRLANWEFRCKKPVTTTENVHLYFIFEETALLLTVKKKLNPKKCMKKEKISPNLTTKKYPSLTSGEEHYRPIAMNEGHS